MTRETEGGLGERRLALAIPFCSGAVSLSRVYTLQAGGHLLSPVAICAYHAGDL